MAPSFVRSISDQCRGSVVPFFFKQWGGINKKAGRELDDRTYDEMPSGSDQPIRTSEERRRMIPAIEALGASFV